MTRGALLGPEPSKHRRMLGTSGMTSHRHRYPNPLHTAVSSGAAEQDCAIQGRCEPAIFRMQFN